MPILETMRTCLEKKELIEYLIDWALRVEEEPCIDEPVKEKQEYEHIDT
jgi:hypothetical protein